MVGGGILRTLVATDMMSRLSVKREWKMFFLLLISGGGILRTEVATDISSRLSLEPGKDIKSFSPNSCPVSGGGILRTLVAADIWSRLSIQSK